MSSLSHPSGKWCKIDRNFTEPRQEFRNRHNNDYREIVSTDQRTARLIMGPSFGSGVIEFFSFNDDLSIIVIDGAFNQIEPINLCGREFLRIHFRLCGKNSLLFDGRAQFDLDGPLAEILFLPQDVKHTDFFSAGSRMKMISIFCSAETLVETLGLEPDRLPEVLGQMCSGETPSLQLTHSRCSKSLTAALVALFDHSISGELHRAYVKVKTLEIVCLFLADLCNEPETEIMLTRRERDRLVEAYECIAAAPGESWTIRELVRLTGMNRNKLTQNFRALFGISVYEHHRRQRFALATRLLNEGGRTISQVAYEAGYAHQSSFAAAFTKEFGVSPRHCLTR